MSVHFVCLELVDEFQMEVYYKIQNSFKFYEIMNIPSEELSTNSLKHLPFIFIDYNAFPLKTYITKLFRQDNMSPEKKYSTIVFHKQEFYRYIFRILATRYRFFNIKINVHSKKKKLNQSFVVYYIIT